MDETTEYTCPSCGESVMVGVDASAGPVQRYIEDCPVCCRPNELRVSISPDGEAHIEARSAAG